MNPWEQNDAVVDPAQPQTETPLDAAPAPWEASDEVVEPGNRIGQMALNGLTFGLRPRIQAAIETGSFSGPEYDKAKEEQWAKDDAYAKANPGTAFVAEVAGAVPTMLVPGLGAARIVQAVNTGKTAVQGVSAGTRAARAVGLGSAVGRPIHEAGVLGAKSAALYGGLGSREDDVEGRLQDAAGSAPLGYGLGGVIQGAGGRLATMAETAYDAVRVGGNSNLGALTSLRRGLDRDNVTTGAIRDAILPDMGTYHIRPEHRETILSAYGQALEGGANEGAARQAAKQAYRTAARAQGITLVDDTLDGHVKRALDRFQAGNDIPLAIDEVAQQTGSRGQNLNWTRRAAMASPGAGKEEAAQAIYGRQENIIPTVREAVDGSVGDSDFEGAFRRLVDRNKANENVLYGAARANETPFDLTPVFQELNATQAFRSGKAGDSVYAAMDAMRARPMADGTFQRHTLDTYIQSRGKLNDLIDASLDPRTGRPTTGTRQLMDIKTKMDKIAGDANPAWRVANAEAGDGRAVQNAMDIGIDIKLTGGAKSREAVQKLRDIRARRDALPKGDARRAFFDDQIEAIQLGFARNLHTSLDGLGDFHDVSKIFLKGGRNSEEGARRTLREVMGDDQANEFLAMIEKARIANSTFRTYGNSQTTPLREAIDDENKFSKFTALLRYMSPSKALEGLADILGKRMNEGRNTQLLNRYSVMTDRPNQFLNLLNEIDSVGLNRAPAFTEGIGGYNAYNSPGLLGGAVSGAFAQDAERE